jgi:hypothetical protein
MDRRAHRNSSDRIGSTRPDRIGLECRRSHLESRPRSQARCECVLCCCATETILCHFRLTSLGGAQHEGHVIAGSRTVGSVLLRRTRANTLERVACGRPPRTCSRAHPAGPKTCVLEVVLHTRRNGDAVRRIDVVRGDRNRARVGDECDDRNAAARMEARPRQAVRVSEASARSPRAGASARAPSTASSRSSPRPAPTR